MSESNEQLTRFLGDCEMKRLLLIGVTACALAAMPTLRLGDARGNSRHTGWRYR
jgi:hypothetical protein